MFGSQPDAAGVLIVEDHPVMRETVRALLEREPDLSVWGEAESFAAALTAVADERPDVVLVDVSLPDASGIELVVELRRRHPELVVVMLSGHREASYVSDAFAAGAQGYILKGRGMEITDAVRHVLTGERYVSAGLQQR